MLKTIKHIARSTKIGFILARNRALFPLDKLDIPKPFLWALAIIPAKKTDCTKELRISQALQELGPIFIKLGQTLSIRPDIVGIDIAMQLSELQDKLPPFSDEIVEESIRAEFGQDIRELFLEFDINSVAAASVAQVHKAVNLDGKQVAVKILRPNIEKILQHDLEYFFWIAKLANKFLPKLRRLKPIEVIEEFKQAIRLEIDLRFEAAAASELKDNCKNDANIYIPEVYWETTSQRILTIEWVDGIGIYNKKEIIEAGHDVDEIAKNVAISFFNQAYRDGFFHADLHPGNIFIDKQGRVVPIDFGIMGRLDKKNRLSVAQILHGFIEKDYVHVAKVHINAGYVPANTDVYLFAQACRSIGEPIVGLPVNQISIAKLLAQLFKITEQFSMETQPQLLLLQKTMVLVEGIGTSLDDKVNMWQLAEPWIKSWAAENMGAKAVIKDKVQTLSDSLCKLSELINNVEKMTAQASENGIKFHPDTIKQFMHERNKRRLSGMEVTIIAAAVAFLTTALAM